MTDQHEDPDLPQRGDVMLQRVPGDPDTFGHLPALPPPPPAALPADTGHEGERRPVIPEQWHRGNVRGTLTQHAALGWHRTRYHGLRVPVYAVKTAWYAVRGVHRVTAAILTWWHWTDGWFLESQAVAAGRPGHSDAMRAHTEGKKTRGTRGRILAVCLVLAICAVLAGAVYLPRWVWPLAALVVLPPLVRAGRPAGKSLIRAAVVPTRYEPPTPEVITRALASLGIPGINQALRDDGRINFVSDVAQSGPGWGCHLDLPYGVTATNILRSEERRVGKERRSRWPPYH